MTGRVKKFSPAGEYILVVADAADGSGPSRKGMGLEPQRQNIIRGRTALATRESFHTRWKTGGAVGCRGTNPGLFHVPPGSPRIARRNLVRNTWGRKAGANARAGRAEPRRRNVPTKPSASHAGPATRRCATGAGENQLALCEVRCAAGAGTNGSARWCWRNSGKSSAKRARASEFKSGLREFAWTRGCIYVADSCIHRSRFFKPDGKFIGNMGGRDGLGQRRYPYDIAVDAQGYHCVCGRDSRIRCSTRGEEGEKKTGEGRKQKHSKTHPNQKKTHKPPHPQPPNNPPPSKKTKNKKKKKKKKK